MSRKPPLPTPLEDYTWLQLIITDARDPEKPPIKERVWCHITPDEKLFLGQIQFPEDKIPDPLSLDQQRSMLYRIPDRALYAPVPRNTSLAIIPARENDNFNASNSYVKGPNIRYFIELSRGNMFWDWPDRREWIPDMLLSEVLITDRICKVPHPFIIKYHGYCHWELREWDKEVKTTMLERIESAVKYLHSLGLAHNDLNPQNVMVRSDGTPALIDFGSCRPFGEELKYSYGTPGWFEEDFKTSEKKHDLYGLKMLEEWLGRVWEKEECRGSCLCKVMPDKAVE
ncbi:serine threonine kinase [Rhypophila decipiens]|uniref:Serine threonine kinase n=1 Tax=Rhypophila decipiens TaxID=261697 RepID=A0AAN6Y130_9PEZI|nr:serine threonine kinase [Rhypophila decipiens]